MPTRTFCILLITAFSAMLGLGVISPFLPVFAEQHGANGFWLGMIFAGFGISRGVIMPLVGMVSDKTGRKIFVTLGLLIYTIISLFYPKAHNVFDLTVIRLIHGLSAGMIIPIVMAYVGDLTEEGKEGRTTGALNTMFFLGVAAGPLMGGILDRYYGFNAVFHMMAVLGAVTLVLVLAFLPEEKAHTIKKEDGSIEIKSLLKYDFIKAILIIVVLCTLMTTVFISFVPSLAMVRHLDTAHIGLIIFVGIVLAGLLQVPFGKVADSLDHTGQLIQIGAGASVSMLALLAMPLCPDFTALLISGAIVGVGAAITTPSLTAIAVQIGHKVGMGSWMGIFMAVRSIGFILTPLIFGIVLDHMGVDSVFYLLALLVVFLGLGAFYFIHRRLKTRQ